MSFFILSPYEAGYDNFNLVMWPPGSRSGTYRTISTPTLPRSSLKRRGYVVDQDTASSLHAHALDKPPGAARKIPKLILAILVAGASGSSAAYYQVSDSLDDWALLLLYASLMLFSLGIAVILIRASFPRSILSVLLGRAVLPLICLASAALYGAPIVRDISQRSFSVTVASGIRGAFMLISGVIGVSFALTGGIIFYEKVHYWLLRPLHTSEDGPPLPARPVAFLQNYDMYGGALQWIREMIPGYYSCGIDEQSILLATALEGVMPKCHFVGVGHSSVASSLEYFIQDSARWFHAAEALRVCSATQFTPAPMRWRVERLLSHEKIMRGDLPTEPDGTKTPSSVTTTSGLLPVPCTTPQPRRLAQVHLPSFLRRRDLPETSRADAGHPFLGPESEGVVRTTSRTDSVRSDVVSLLARAPEARSLSVTPTSGATQGFDRPEPAETSLASTAASPSDSSPESIALEDLPMTASDVCTCDLQCTHPDSVQQSLARAVSDDTTAAEIVSIASAGSLSAEALVSHADAPSTIEVSVKSEA